MSLGQYACKVDRYLGPGERVLRSNQLIVSMSDSTEVTSEVKEALANAQQYYSQSPNKRILKVPVMLGLYTMAAPQDSSLWGRIWHRTGEAPIIYNPAAAQRTINQLSTLLKTKGCFGAKVEVDTTDNGHGYVDAIYHVTVNNRRMIDEVQYYSRQPEIAELLNTWKAESLLKVGNYYDQQQLNAEQKRLVSLLKDKGYYTATDDVVHFFVDTTYDSRSLSILVSVRNRKQDANNQPLPLQKYHIDNIYIYPNISTSITNRYHTFDTLHYSYKTRRGSNIYNFIYDKEITPTPKVISRAMFIFNGMTYRPQIASSTSNSMLGLHNFKYVDINFEESPNSTDTNRLLDARIRLLNSTRHRLSLSFELTNASDFSNEHETGNIFTTGNLGLGTTLGYQNHNLFGGAEMLNLEGSLILDMPKDVFSTKEHTFYNTFSNFETNLTTSLDLPAFLLPFGNRIVWQNSKPHTLFEFNINYLFRDLSVPDISTGIPQDITLERNRIGASFGYTWSHNRNIQHKLLPINFSYSRLVSGDEFYNYLTYLTSDPQFSYQAVDYVLLNTHYEYTYSNQIIGKRQNFNFFHLSVETAGNLLNLADILFLSNQGVLNNEDLIYYQYLRLEGELKRYIYLGQRRTFVLRTLGGIALPYGHSTFIPYERMFVGGGPTTMRGWALRHLGYGQFPTSESNFAMGTGEIQLVVNLEHRFPLFSIFEGAIFADMGNVWEYEDWGIGRQKTFSPTEILRGVALDAGLGLRANVSIITIRLDLALPIYDPGYPIDHRWINQHWAWNKLVANFGINYPF